MEHTHKLKPIAHIYNDLHEKFGIPRQSGLVPALTSTIVFEKTYRTPEALRGIENFSHLWLIWQFSACKNTSFHPTVRPPRLGGNKRIGVFASRSPFRPNRLGLSSVRLEKVLQTEGAGFVLVVSGADIMNGTPIFDIKPYLPYTDSHADAKGSFAEEFADYRLTVICPPQLLKKVDKERQQVLINLLEGDPRPAYQADEDRIYKMGFAQYEVHFKVQNNTLTVLEIYDQ